MEARPQLVGIAGPSGGGKTVLARALEARMPSSTLIQLDDYYKDVGELDPRLWEQRNFDHPDTIDSRLLHVQLRDLAAGDPVQMPVYDFATHSRNPARRTVVPGPIVIVDGLFCLYWKEIRELLDARVFVELDHATCLARRIDRDTRRRGRTADSVRKQYEETVRPMFERYVGPTRAHANLVLSGAGDPEENATAVLAHFGLASSGA